MKCLVCQKNKAVYDPSLGYLSCKQCRANAKKSTLPYEFTTESIRQSRKEFAKDILQSSRDGVLSKERLEAYGTKGLKVTKEQIDKAAYVWNDRESLSYKKGNPKLI
jgi:hypothetical protein